MGQANTFLEEIQTLIKNSSKSSSLLVAQINRCQVSAVKEDIRTVYSRSKIVQLMILMKLMSIPSIHRLMGMDLRRIIPFGKDLLYRVRKNCKIHWRKILLNLSYKAVIKANENEREGSWGKPCFIIDDTDMPKSGKCMEFIGWIYSHFSRRYCLGYKCLNLAYWTGKHLVHIDFSLHAEMGKGKNQGMTQKALRQRYSKHRDEQSAGYSRVKELFEKKTECAIRMLRRAIGKGFDAAYVLADSWFFSSKLVNFVKGKNIHLISRPKFNHWKYEYNEKAYTLGALVKKIRYQKKKWNRKFRMHHATATVVFKSVQLKIFFYKEKKRGSKWQAIITTDRTLGAIQAYEIYQNRWSIEVSYKELKQHLGFGQCASRDFDGQISDITMSLAAYNLLSQVKAVNEYESIGHLFDNLSRQHLSPTLMQRFWGELYNAIQEIAQLVDANFEQLLNRVISSTSFAKDWQRINLALTSET